MQIRLKTKIWLTMLIIVLMFAFFSLFYFPAQQGKLLLKNYNTEVQNLANTVSLGVKIALTEQNFEGMRTAMKFVNDDPRLQFVSVLQYDTLWNTSHTNYKIQVSVFQTSPENEHPIVNAVSNDSVIIKYSPFQTAVMSGSVMLAFTTRDIVESKRKIRRTSLIVSSIVLLIGILLGLWLARTISVPVLALRDAAKRVGEGDLTQRVHNRSRDEIGELGKAFNTMTEDLSRARKELHETNNWLTTANDTLNNTLAELKATQAQLIQSEKMASLGELTAGIAHEIQNPLNFVNNFSELNIELIEEIKTELANGNYAEAERIANDLMENEKKIVYHGKRADGIVKGMMQHSRAGAGRKELTDLNALVDEYLRLSYHGLRARDKNFSVTLKTDFDKSMGAVNIIPHEIGRVLLNLFTNAFYAVTEKKRNITGNMEQAGYEPEVSVCTKRTAGKAEIEVTDNGAGIPSKILDKIFQPFFTTKPTGQGTGLGLSISYDIVKSYGGEIKVATSDAGMTSFKVQLPVINS